MDLPVENVLEQETEKETEKSDQKGIWEKVTSFFSLESTPVVEKVEKVEPVVTEVEKVEPVVTEVEKVEPVVTEVETEVEKVESVVTEVDAFKLMVASIAAWVPLKEPIKPEPIESEPIKPEPESVVDKEAGCFLTADQQMALGTTLDSRRDQSYDIRDTILFNKTLPSEQTEAMNPPVSPIVPPAPRNGHTNFSFADLQNSALIIPCFKNLTIDVLLEVIKHGQMFAADGFEENYLSLPEEIRLKYTYEAIQMTIDDIHEVVAYRIIKRDSDSDTESEYSDSDSD